MKKDIDLIALVVEDKFRPSFLPEMVLDVSSGGDEARNIFQGIKIQNNFSFINPICCLILEELVSNHSFPEEKVNELLLVLYEILINIILHNTKPDSFIILKAALEGSLLDFYILDKGDGLSRWKKEKMKDSSKECFFLSCLTPQVAWYEKQSIIKITINF